MFLAERYARRDEPLKMNYEYIMGWETDNAEGLRGAFDAEQRDKELDADGVAAEVIFPDADAITGMAGPPFGAGLSAGEITEPELAFAGAHAHNRFLVELCSHQPERRGGVGLVPITHDIERAVHEIEWLAQQPGIRVARVGGRPNTAWTRSGRSKASRPHPGRARCQSSERWRILVTRVRLSGRRVAQGAARGVGP